MEGAAEFESEILTATTHIRLAGSVGLQGGIIMPFQNPEGLSGRLIVRRFRAWLKRYNIPWEKIRNHGLDVVDLERLKSARTDSEVLNQMRTIDKMASLGPDKHWLMLGVSDPQASEQDDRLRIWQILEEYLEIKKIDSRKANEFSKWLMNRLDSQRNSTQPAVYQQLSPATRGDIDRLYREFERGDK